MFQSQECRWDKSSSLHYLGLIYAPAFDLCCATQCDGRAAVAL